MTTLNPTAPVALAECPTLSPERQLLWDAANWMQEHGWCPRFCDETGAGCALRAIGMSRGERSTQTKETAISMLRKHVGQRYIATWSDSSDQATVVAALRSAALT